MTNDTVRRAVILRSRSGAPTIDEVAAYLPSNYKAIGQTPGAVTIEGHDVAGWTLDDYVIPRLGSGLIHAFELPQGQRLLHQIYDEIKREWKRPYFAAIPYLEALRYMATKWDKFNEDDGDSIIRLFLGNAKYWRGDAATRIKAELRTILNNEAKREVRR